MKWWYALYYFFPLFFCPNSTQNWLRSFQPLTRKRLSHSINRLYLMKLYHCSFVFGCVWHTLLSSIKLQSSLTLIRSFIVLLFFFFWHTEIKSHAISILHLKSHWIESWLWSFYPLKAKGLTIYKQYFYRSEHPSFSFYCMESVTPHLIYFTFFLIIILFLVSCYL